MICRKCGSALPSEGFICKRCGAMMNEDQIKEQNAYMKENKTKYQTKLVSEEYGKHKLFQARDKENDTNKLMGLVVVLGVLLFIIIIAIVVYLG